MTDAITLLTGDHRTVNGLFEQVEGQPSPSADVVHDIVAKLSIHDAIEKEYLYPAIRKHVDGGDNYADRSIKEHDEVAETLLAVDRAENGSADQSVSLKTLIDLVRTHVEEEEMQVFPALKASCSAEELEELGHKLSDAKGTAPTRPHPLAPSGGFGTKVAGALSAPLDKAKDVIEGR
jgi:hemerythrin superfamily protein